MMRRNKLNFDPQNKQMKAFQYLYEGLRTNIRPKVIK